MHGFRKSLSLPTCTAHTHACMPMQYLNPSETFGDIMVDYSYVECTSACITALCAFRSKYPGHRSAEISKSLKKGEKS